MKKHIIFLTLCCFLMGCTEKAIPPVAGVWFNHDRRTTGTLVDDQAITIKANLAISKDKAIWNESHVSTLSYNNALLLVGQTKSPGNKARIEALMKPIPEITTIYNQITIDKPLPIGVRAKDSWISTQVKAKLLSDRNIGPNRIKVITEDGVVYLMGMLSKDEELIAQELTRKISGVQRVVKIIESFEAIG